MQLITKVVQIDINPKRLNTITTIVRATTLNKMERDKLIDIFNETISLVSKHKSYEKPNGDIYEFKPVGETFTYSSKININDVVKPYDGTDVIVADADCLDTAKKFIKDGCKCAVLNMASFIRPGGGVLKGSAAQEESLFRRTNLFMSLYQFSGDMYQVTGIDKPILDVYPLSMRYGAIYSKNITVFRTSERTSDCHLMDDPFTIDVITIAAVKKPQLENGKLPKWVTEVLEGKVEMMLDLCAIHGIDTPILGAFGCGAYGTPPEEMAKIFSSVIRKEKYKRVFRHIVFPIIDDHNSRKEHNPEGNFKPFNDILPHNI